MIHAKYLDVTLIQQIYIDAMKQHPIQYFVWEDFIDPEIYTQVEKEIQSQKYENIDIHHDEHRNNKTVLLEGEYLQKIFNFFQSTQFEKYLSLYLRQDIKQEFYVNTQNISEILGKKFIGAAAQTYEKGDFFDWHIDGPLEKGSLGAFTYYLGGYEGKWDTKNGGNLELGTTQKSFPSEIRSHLTIPYKKNTLIFIQASPIAYHRVTPMMKDIPRLSIQSTLFKK